jgi:regulation of enolase protein 1 (concanavalin A-like superfamily)
MSTLDVPRVPFPLTPSAQSTWELDPTDGQVSVIALPHSDIFVAPGAGESAINSVTNLNAATLLAEAPGGDFQFTARVGVDFVSAFDAGVLLLWLNERYWAKLCFEYSPGGEPMIVSVVNREVADDANSFIGDGRLVWLRVSRIDDVYAYHASIDGVTWQFVRAFVLALEGVSPSIGLEAQSPTGEGCAVTFSNVSFTSTRLADIRDGT